MAVANNYDSVIEFITLKAIVVVDNTWLVVLPEFAIAWDQNDDRAILKSIQVSGCGLSCRSLVGDELKAGRIVSRSLS